MADVHYEGERFLFRGEIRQYHLGQVIKVNITNNRTNDTMCLLMGHTEKDTTLPTSFLPEMFNPNLITRNNQTNPNRQTLYKTNGLCFSNTNVVKDRKREGNCSKFRETESKGLLNAMRDL